MKAVRTELKKIPDLQVFVMDTSLRGFASTGGYPIELTLMGPDWARLGTLSAATDG